MVEGGLTIDRLCKQISTLEAKRALRNRGANETREKGGAAKSGKDKGSGSALWAGTSDNHGQRTSAAGGQRGQNRGRRFSNASKDTICYQCGGLGHFAKNCPSTRGDGQRPRKGSAATTTSPGTSSTSTSSSTCQSHAPVPAQLQPANQTVGQCEGHTRVHATCRYTPATGPPQIQSAEPRTGGSGTPQGSWTGGHSGSARGGCAHLCEGPLRTTAETWPDQPAAGGSQAAAGPTGANSTQCHFGDRPAEGYSCLGDTSEVILCGGGTCQPGRCLWAPSCWLIRPGVWRS